MPGRRSERVVLEANTAYWDPSRMPRVKRIVFDNTLSQAEAIELLKRGDPRVDLVTGLSPLETRRVSESPAATVVKNRASSGGGFGTVLFGQFNLRKPGSPWQDVRLRRAANLAINRADLVRYAANGNGTVISTILPDGSFGHDPDVTAYPFDPAQARALLREAGHPNGLALDLIAPRTLEVQATVVERMLGQVGFQVTRQVLERPAYDRRFDLDSLEGPPERQTWDLALATWASDRDFPLFGVYHHFGVYGRYSWGLQDVLRPQYDQVLSAVDRDRQGRFLRQLERYISEQAHFLFLYSPITLWAVNRAVRFAPHADPWVIGVDLALTDQHWSVQPGGAKP